MYSSNSRKLLTEWLPKIPITKGARMTDIGCNNAVLLRTMHQCGMASHFRYHGIDPDASEIDGCRLEYGEHAKFTVGSLPDEIPSNIHSDIVVCLSTMQFVNDWRCAINTIKKMGNGGNWLFAVDFTVFLDEGKLETSYQCKGRLLRNSSIYRIYPLSEVVQFIHGGVEGTQLLDYYIWEVNEQQKKDIDEKLDDRVGCVMFLIGMNDHGAPQRPVT